MKSFCRYILLLFAVVNLPLCALCQIDTAEVMKTARKVPSWSSKSPEKLAEVLAKPCSNDEETIFAFAYWICRNIKLDYSEIEKRPAENKTIKKVLNSRKALSDGYVKLFVEMCKSQKIPAVYVPGYTKDYDFMSNDTLYRAEYAWALVNVSNEWYIMDLAAASCKIVSVVSPISKVLWTLFKIPYASHLKAVKSFNPNYLYIDPVKSLERRYPVADMFQLVRFPMSISYFMQGDSATRAYFSNYPEVETLSKPLDEFSEKTAIDKYIYVANQSFLTNPMNQYTKALYYYYALKSYFNTYYIAEKGKIFAPLEESQKAWNYARIADSLFTIATQNNLNEMNAKQVRSDLWKVNLVESNKALSAQLSLQAKVNNQQERSISKINGLNKKIVAYIGKYKGKYVLRDIVDLQRPMIQNKDLLVEGTAKINDSYDILQNCKRILHEYDSVMANVKKPILDSVFKNQKEASNMCNNELNSLSRYLDRKGSNLSLVYYSDKYVFKKSYFTVFEMVGEINEKYTDRTIETLNETIPQVFEYVKIYINEITKALATIKAAKVLLANDYGEDDLYERTALEFNKQLERIESELNDITNYNNTLDECLGSDEDMYKEIVKMLQNDNSMETYRHKEYMAYRKSIKQAENDKIKYYQTTIRNYQKLIGKAIPAE